MHVCYDPDTLEVRHIITIGFADCHLSDGSSWLRLDGFVPPHELVLKRSKNGEIVAKRGAAKVKSMAVASAADSFPKPERTLKGARVAALARINRRMDDRAGAAREASAFLQRKEAWARDHLAGNVAHPVIGREAVEKKIACHDLCNRIVAKAEAARAKRAATLEAVDQVRSHAAGIVKALQSIEEIDEYMTHFG